MLKSKAMKIYSNEKESVLENKGNHRYIIFKEFPDEGFTFKTYVVVDTHKGLEKSSHFWNHSMCETFDEESAIQICKALNDKFHSD